MRSTRGILLLALVALGAAGCSNDPEHVRAAASTRMSCPTSEIEVERVCEGAYRAQVGCDGTVLYYECSSALIPTADRSQCIALGGPPARCL